MTITEKILAAHASRRSVSPGENIWCSVDLLLTHDICGPGTIGVFQEHFGPDAKVFDPDKIVIIPDHYIFTAEPKAHRNVEILRDFVKAQGIRHYYDPEFLPRGFEGMPQPYADPATTSYRGVCHVALPQGGHARPGQVLLGTDSHTCTHGAFGQFATGIGDTDAGFVMGTGKLWLKVPASMKFILTGVPGPYVMAKDVILHIIGEIGADGATYRAMEFTGEAIAGLNMDERCTVCNMAVEAGAKNAIIAPDRVTLDYVAQRRKAGTPESEVYQSDADGEYFSVMELNTADLEPTVAEPHSPQNRALAREVTGVKIDRSYIGSCTGGKTADLVAAAKVLAGNQVTVDTYIVPATVEVDRDLDRCEVQGKSLREIFSDAGCKVGPASCAACLGGPADTFGRANEAITVISTTNRNFRGRMGNPRAEVYLASPLTAAASAIEGRVADPRRYIDD